MKTPLAINLIEKWSYDYIKMDCAEGKCYGVLAVHRICFALSLFHLIIGSLLIGVKDTKDKRAAIQNGWWGPKTLLWLVLVVVSFLIPNGFFMIWGNYVALIGATLFIVLGLVLLVDFAHSWSEMCLENWENSSHPKLWQWILLGSTMGMYSVTLTLTGVLYGYFAGSECTLNRFFVTFNLILVVIITILCIHPAVQESNPRSGLAQSSMVAVYCTYLIMSAIGNRQHASCNPLQNNRGAAEGTRTTTVVVGAIFTFLAIAYSTSRAATQSRALVGKKKGYITISDDSSFGDHGLITSQPGRTETPRYQAILAAVEAGALPASVLDEEDDDDDGVTGDERDDERSGTRYNYSWFHVIFAIGAMYVAMLLTDWNVVKTSPMPGTPANSDDDVFIGRSEVAMWMRVVSSWVCMLLYIWSLLAPVLMPDRFGDL